MNEIKLIEEIEDAIHNKKYDELLYKVELKLKKLFYKYTTEDVLTLINRTIISIVRKKIIPNIKEISMFH